MVRDHEAVNKQAPALLDKLKVKPEDNDTSKSLADAASKKHEELYQLDGTAFDKAYAENEVTNHQTVNGALEKTLIPSAQNAELKSLLQTGLKLFKEHEKHAEKLVGDRRGRELRRRSSGWGQSPDNFETGRRRGLFLPFPSGHARTAGGGPLTASEDDENAHTRILSTSSSVTSSARRS